MAQVTKQYLVEQVQALLAGGSPSAGAKYERRMIESFLQAAINKKLKSEYFNVTLPGGETIPESLMLASYDAVKVQKYKGLSRAKLPAMPISLRRGMGVYFVGPSVMDNNLDTPILQATAASATEIDLVWMIVANATTYYVQRATNALFTIGLTDIYLGTGVSFSDIGVTVGTTYYYRVIAKANGYFDSSYGYASATPAVVISRLLINGTDSLLINGTDKFII